MVCRPAAVQAREQYLPPPFGPGLNRRPHGGQISHLRRPSSEHFFEQNRFRLPFDRLKIFADRAAKSVPQFSHFSVTIIRQSYRVTVVVEVALLSARITADTRELETGIASANKSVLSFGQSMQQGLGIGLGFNALQAVISGVGAAFGALKSSAIDFNQTLDGAAASMSRFFDNTTSLNNSIAYLNQLAAKTPFAFEGLLTAQQRIIGSARSADELKQNMDAVAVAAANTGRVSTANMERISLALGQMQTKGHLAGGEMLQLTEAGVNMGEMLAKHFGVSTAAIQKMTEEGKISSQDVWATLRENAADPRNREALEKMSKTWEGAWSTISDVGKSTIAGVFRPFFDLLTEGAVAIANFVQSATFQVWAQVVTNAFSAAASAVRSFLSFLAPVGDMIASSFQSLGLGGIVLDEVKDATPDLKAAGGNAMAAVGDGMKTGMASAKGAVDGLADEIRGVSKVIADLSFEHTGLKNSIDDVKQAYEDQLKPLKDQLELIQHKSEASQKEQELQFKLADIELRRAQVAAMGDPVKRAELTRQLALIQEKEKELGIEDSIAQVKRDKEKLADDGKKATLEDLQYKRQLQALDEDGKKYKLEDLRYSRELQALEEKLASQRKNHGDTEGLVSQIKELKLQRDITLEKRKDDAAANAEKRKELELRHQMALDQRKTDAEEAERKRKALDLKGEELGVQKDLSSLTDKGKLAEIAGQKELLTQQKESYEVTKATADIETEKAKADILGQIKAINDEEEARLRPMQDQLKEIERQKQAQEEIKKGLELQKADLQDVVAGYKEAAKAAKESAANQAIPGAPKGGISFDLDPTSAANQAKIKQAAAAFGGGIRDAISGWLADHPITLATLSDWTNAFLDWARVAESQLLKQLSGMIGSVVGWIEDNAGPIGNELYAWALAFIQWVPDAGVKLLTRLLEMRLDLEKWIAQATTFIDGKLLDWATAFVAWVRPKVPELLGALGDMLSALVEWVGTSLGTILDSLGEWAVAFVDWVGPKIPPLLEELGGLLVAVVDWLANIGLPGLTTKLLDWGAALFEWIGPRIPKVLEQLGLWALAIEKWLVFTALPSIVIQLGKWGLAFAQWVNDLLSVSNPNNLQSRLLLIFLAIGKWVDEVIVDLVGVAARLGEAMLNGIQEGLTNKWGDLKDWITENIGKKLPEEMQQLLGIHSPSTVFHDIGENLVLGLISGMQSKKDELIKAATSVFSFGDIGGDVPGDLDDWLNAAIKVTGVGKDWLPGLRWLAMHESTGRPHAVNKEAVSTGEHASGLMQTIPSTFAAYRNRDLPNDIFNPVANAAAAIEYIKKRYGTVQNVIEGWRDRGGYAKGGVLPEDVTAVSAAGNMYRLHGGEGIFNPEQMARLAPVGTGGGSVTVNVVVQGNALSSKEEIATAVVIGLQHAQRTGRTKVSVI